jgi:hypothetical protein
MPAALALCAVCVAPALWADDGGMLDVKAYSSLFLNAGGLLSRKYYKVASDDDYARVAALGGESATSVDTPLEIALLSTCAGVVDVRPVDAVNMLGNAQSADLKLGAAVLQEVKILGFLGNRDAAGRYEAMLAFITGRGNAARAEIEAFYRQNVGALVSAEVDAQFNRVDFLLRGSPNGSYNAVLTRDAKTGQYKLSYEGFFNGTESTKELTATSLETLPSVMLSSRDFNQATVNSVRAQAALMPAVKLAPKEIAAIRDVLTAFYVAPTQVRYDAVRDLHAIYSSMSFLSNDKETYTNVDASYLAAVKLMSSALVRKIIDDVHSNPNIVSNLAPSSPRNAESLAEKVR